jgi:NADP-dependent 3-hydroxy acid dehydrogenase YdfG
VLDVPTDVRDAEAVRSLVAKTVDAFGRVDILTTIAGVISLGSAESSRGPSGTAFSRST